LIAVPTPFCDGHKPDLSYIKAAAMSIAPVLQKGNLVILESTSPVGTTEQLAGWLAEARPDLSFPQQLAEAADIQIAYCPERVLPGRVVHELVENDRVIGGMTRTATYMAAALYKTFVLGELVATNARTAEMCKLTENSFRDVNIAFANELSIICDKLDINVWELIALANRHPRVNILQPGAGVGGHCIAVDPWFIVDKTPDEARIIRTAREVNDHKPEWVLIKVREALVSVSSITGKAVQDITVACMGLTFKPDIDDLRESPALDIAHAVARLGCRTLTAEPNICETPPSLKALGVELQPAAQAADAADVVVWLVKHKPFHDLVTQYKNKTTIDAVGFNK
jgi:UDP-N-acetyl-D-mannosaminuronic acid dehydrogenase